MVATQIHLGSVIGALVRWKTICKVLTDCTAWAIAILFTTLARYEFNPGLVDWRGLITIVVVATALQTAVGSTTGLYRRTRRTGTFDEIDLLASSAMFTTVLATAVNVVAGAPRFVPLTGTVVGGFVALALMGGARYIWRLHVERNLRPLEAPHRLVVFGAGEAGASIIASLLRTPNSPYLPVALLDDDPRKSRLRVMGVPVRGTREELVEVARQTQATTLLIAVPSGSGALMRDLAGRAADAKLEVKVLPSVSDILNGNIELEHIRELREADLLGRHQIETDLHAIAGYLTGKRVLVTGAGGSIGAELCRQVRQFAPERLVMLDRDESALHAVQLSIEGRALLDVPELVLCDIRDRAAVERAFTAHRPQVVFHTAALKHLPLLERHPGEALRTNVWATLDLLEIAAGHDVERFVTISTDKAANPTSVLGYSKRLAERLTAHAAAHSTGTFLSVRFGNVLGSRGSALSAFEVQISAGGPVTVTHPDVMRYFMTVGEACQLVIQAAAVGTRGYVHVLDMGEPVAIADLVKRLVEQANRPTEIIYTGLRPGEKLRETLWGHGEADVRPAHPLVSHVTVPPIDPAMVRRLSPDTNPEALAEQMRALAAGSAPQEIPDQSETGISLEIRP